MQFTNAIYKCNLQMQFTNAIYKCNLHMYLHICIEKINICLFDCDENVFFYLSILLKTSNTAKIVWKMMLDLTFEYKKMTEVLLALKFFFNIMTHKDYWIYLYNAILIVIKRKVIDFDEKKTFTFYKREEVDELVNINLSLNKFFTIDDYVYDQHTATNYKVGDKVRFALESAYVKDECTTFLNCEYRRLYVLNKYLVDRALSQNKRKSFKICDINDEGIKKKIKIDFTKFVDYSKPIEKSETDKGDYIIDRNFSENKKKDTISDTSSSSTSSSSDEHVTKANRKFAETIDVKFFFLNYTLTNIDCNEQKRIERLPKAQLKTAIWKKYIHVDHLDFVYKGPYALCDVKFYRNLQIIPAIKYLENLLNIAYGCIVSNSCMDWIELLRCKHDNSYYLVAKKIGRDLTEGELCTQFGEDVFILKRNSFCSRVSDLEKTKPFSEKISLQILKHLYLRFLLNIGDSGTHNILFDSYQDKIVGIDFDEMGTNLFRFKISECLFKRNGYLYESFFDKMKVFTSVLNNCEEVMQLETIGVDTKDLNSRIVHFNSLL
jgi:hypothetical protein